jgi:hypothetical protein
MPAIPTGRQRRSSVRATGRQRRSSVRVSQWPRPDMDATGVHQKSCFIWMYRGAGHPEQGIFDWRRNVGFPQSRVRAGHGARGPRTRLSGDVDRDQQGCDSPMRRGARTLHGPAVIPTTATVGTPTGDDSQNTCRCGLPPELMHSGYRVGRRGGGHGQGDQGEDDGGEYACLLRQGGRGNRSPRPRPDPSCARVASAGLITTPL